MDKVPPESTRSSLEPRAGRIQVAVGSTVSKGGVLFCIIKQIDFQYVLGRNLTSQCEEVLTIDDLSLAPATVRIAEQLDIDAMDEPSWRKAQKRYSIIKPLLDLPRRGRRHVVAAAKASGNSPATLYRWLALYDAYGVVTALLPISRGCKKGQKRVDGLAERIIKNTIDELYLTKNRVSIRKTYIQIVHLAESAGITPPSMSTLRRRIGAIPDSVRESRRNELPKNRIKYRATPGTFPGGDFPLQVLQIDHTPLDLIIVDDETRLPIGRPFLTLAIDVFSRMVAGYFLGLNPPSNLSVSCCISLALNMKSDWLQMHGLDFDWPLWGFPQKIFVDNAKEFRSNTFVKSCNIYGINLEFRPVKTPHYGAHIERLLGTFNVLVHDVPGTTFSSINQRGNYDSNKEAAATFSEAERWILNTIDAYHNARHSALGTTPLRRWHEGIFGDGVHEGTGLPNPPSDPQKLILDFLEGFERTIQPDGVRIEGKRYFGDALRPWISRADHKTGRSRPHIFRRDPRNISEIWFYDPDLNRYFKIHDVDLRAEKMSVYEYRRQKKDRRRDDEINADSVIVRKRNIEKSKLIDEAKTLTKQKRRAAQRKKEDAKQKYAVPFSENIPASRVDTDDDGFNFVDEDDPSIFED